MPIFKIARPLINERVKGIVICKASARASQANCIDLPFPATDIETLYRTKDTVRGLPILSVGQISSTYYENYLRNCVARSRKFNLNRTND